MDNFVPFKWQKHIHMTGMDSLFRFMAKLLRKNFRSTFHCPWKNFGKQMSSDDDNVATAAQENAPIKTTELMASLEAHGHCINLVHDQVVGHIDIPQIERGRRRNTSLSYDPVPSKRMKKARPSIKKGTIGHDDDTWVEVLVWCENLGLIRSYFTSKNTQVAYWGEFIRRPENMKTFKKNLDGSYCTLILLIDEPPSGASKIVKLAEVSRVYIRDRSAPLNPKRRHYCVSRSDRTGIDRPASDSTYGNSLAQLPHTNDSEFQQYLHRFLKEQANIKERLREVNEILRLVLDTQKRAHRNNSTDFSTEFQDEEESIGFLIVG